MDADAIAATLIEELRTLRKGRAMHAPTIDRRVGPTLRTAFGVGAEDSAVEVRQKIGNGLARLASRLPPDLKVSTIAAFALSRDASQPFYQDRAKWAAGQLGRDERTIRRRIDLGIRQLAELAAADIVARSADDAGADVVGRWHTEWMSLLMYLDQPTPEAFEFRRIVADQDDLAEIDLSVTLTAPSERGDPDQSRLGMDALYGGSLSRRAMESAQRFGMVLALPKPLRRGERHEFALRFRVSEEQRMRPHFVGVVAQPCEQLDLRVKFDEKQPPAAVWRLTKVFKDELDDPVHRVDGIAVDAAHELRIQFTDLAPGFAYGVQWDEADQ